MLTTLLLVVYGFLHAVDLALKAARRFTSSPTVAKLSDEVDAAEKAIEPMISNKAGTTLAILGVWVLGAGALGVAVLTTESCTAAERQVIKNDIKAAFDCGKANLGAIVKSKGLPVGLVVAQHFATGSDDATMKSTLEQLAVEAGEDLVGCAVRAVRDTPAPQGLFAPPPGSTPAERADRVIRLRGWTFVERT